MKLLSWLGLVEVVVRDGYDRCCCYDDYNQQRKGDRGTKAEVGRGKNFKEREKTGRKNK